MHSRAALIAALCSLVISLVLVLHPGAAWADACTDPPPAGFGGAFAAGTCTVSAVAAVNPGVYSIPGHLVITTTGGIDASHDLAGPLLNAGITINVAGNLTIQQSGFIDASDDATALSPGGANELDDDAKPITLNVTGSVELFSNARITSENTRAAGDGGVITIGAGGNVTLHNNGGSAPGAKISSARTVTGGAGRGGDIFITAGPPAPAATGDVVIEEHSIVTAGAHNLTSGKIEIRAGHKIVVDGHVLSESTVGNSARGGPIFLVTCDLLIGDSGRVSSLGNDPGPDLVHVEGCVVRINGLVQSTGEAHGTLGAKLCRDAPRGPAHNQSNRVGFDNWTACVEVWSGTTIVIDGLNANGQINADTALAGGSEGGGWIDLFANGDITILGGAGAFAVHASQPVGATRRGGLVQVLSLGGSVTASGNALAADGNPAANGGRGGEIILQGDNVTLNGASISAQGDNTAGGGFGVGGIIDARAFSGAVSWTSGTGNVLPTGDNVPAANDGSIILTACTAVNPGAAFSDNDDPDPGFPAVTTGACAPAAPALGAASTLDGDYSYVVLPPANCLQLCGGGTPGDGDCEKSSVRSVLDRDSGRFHGNDGPDVVIKVHAPANQLIQSFVDAATDKNGDGYIILLVVGKDNGALGGHTTQHVVIDKQYPAPFALIACSVTLHAEFPNQPTGRISAAAGSPANIFVMDLHAADSLAEGWAVAGDGRYLRNVNTLDNATGLAVTGDGNTIHNGTAQGNTADGIQVTGGANLVRDAKAFANGGHGIAVFGDGNTVAKVDAGDRNKGNIGDGVHVEGAGNTVSEADAFANEGHGIFVRGDGNQLEKNNAGDRNKGNLGDGLRVGGQGNALAENDAYGNTGHGVAIFGNGNTLKGNRSGDAGKGNGADGFHVEGSQNSLDSNRASGNGGDGFDFARAAGVGNVLKNNRSNDGSALGQKENAGCEYRFAEGSTVDAGGNKEDGASFTGVAGKYPAGCQE